MGRKGLSTFQLKKYIKVTYTNEAQGKLLNKALKTLVTKTEINQKKGHYVMSKEQKADKKKLAIEKRKKVAEKSKMKKEAMKAKKATKRKAKQTKKKTAKKTSKKTAKKTSKKTTKKTATK